MKKIKLFSLLAATLLAGSTMAADYTPTTIYTVGDDATLGANWKTFTNPAPANYYVINKDTFVFNPYILYQSTGATNWQTWSGMKEANSGNVTYDALPPFVASTDWGTDAARYVATRTSCTFTYYVTNCSAVWVYGNPNGDSRQIITSAYELTVGETITVSETTVATANITGKTNGISKLEGLEPTKAYSIVVSGSDGSNGMYYQIAFIRAQAENDATLKSITINGEALEEFAPATTTYNVVLPTGTTQVPTVVATPYAGTAVVTAATSLPGTTTIEVTAKDGITKQTYTIHFTVATCVYTELVLSAESIEAIFETEELVAPVLANPHNLSVVYATSNEEVVTVDQTGALTKVGVGEAVITITAAKQTVEGIEYCEEEVSYKVTLTAHPITGSTTIFEWVVASSNLTAPTADSTSLDAANYGTLTTGKSIVNRYFGDNKFEVSSGMYKLGNNDVAVEFATEGGFLAEDEITIVGQNGGTGERGFAIGNILAKAADTKGNIKSTTQSDNSTIKTYTAVVDETIEGEVLRLFRLAGKTMYLKSIQVVRPCTVESGLVLDKTAIDVLDSEKTITAPNLDNPNELVVKYESSNTEVVAVDANTGALTKGTKTGMATITISWERQTINFVRYCAGELVYTVTVKSGATAVENTAVAAPAVKVIRDGQLLIIREGKTYTAQGMELR